MYVPEANVIGFLHKYHLPLVKNPCPADGETKREYVKQLVRQINLENPGVKKTHFPCNMHRQNRRVEYQWKTMKKHITKK
jgi:tRNA(Ile)-lysidine synthase TilS/MesJ